MVLQNPVTQPAQFKVAQKNRKHILILHLGSLEAVSTKVFGCKVVDLAGRVVLHRGGSVTKWLPCLVAKEHHVRKRRISCSQNIFGAK